MNPELIHDALTLLPPDLIGQTDLLRNRPRHRRNRWLPLISAAACLVLVVGSVMLMQSRMQKSAPTGAVPEAPAMMQAAPMAPETAVDEAPAMEEAAEAPAADASRNSTNSTASGTALAAPVTIRMAGASYTLGSEDSARLNALLTALDYGQQPESDIPSGITAQSDAIGHITLNLKDGYARSDSGQAALTEEQIELIWEMILRVSDGNS